MTANELRVGNIIQQDGINVKVRCIFKVSINGIDAKGNAYQLHYDLLSGIPLTPEFLLKLGFKIGHNKGFDSYYNGISLSYIQGEFKFGITTVKYLHHLQNLHFACMLFELTIEL